MNKSKSIWKQLFLFVCLFVCFPMIYLLFLIPTRILYLSVHVCVGKDRIVRQHASLFGSDWLIKHIWCRGLSMDYETVGLVAQAAAWLWREKNRKKARTCKVVQVPAMTSYRRSSPIKRILRTALFMENLFYNYRSNMHMDNPCQHLYHWNHIAVGSSPHNHACPETTQQARKATAPKQRAMVGISRYLATL